ncbi:MAG: ABC transporter ATP-binding protein [Hyphomonadaceae bacterium]|jgi:putative ABC transport system ATP-binding protein
MADTDLIVLRNIAKTYRRGEETISIFSDLNLTIPSGDFVAMMGPSGSGKTTLLNLLGGLDRPTSGTILFDGAPIEKLSENQLSAWRAANVGFIFQFYNLMPTMSAARNVELPLLLTPLSAADRRRRVKTALDIVGLADRAGHKPKELSGGQQQRVAIARAIVADPKLILADEPTGDLDRMTAEEILGMLQLLNRELGKTIVMVTHDPAAAKYARRELHLNKGSFEERLT